MSGVPVGTPYRKNGRDAAGVDCWGVVLAERPELPLVQYCCADRRRFNALAGREVASGHWQAVWPPAPGDVVLMGSGNGRLTHAGIAVPGGVKHAKLRTGVVIESVGALCQVYGKLEAWRWRG